METIGYAALQVVPSMRGVSASMNRQLSGIMPQAGQKAGEQMGTGVSSGFGKTIGGMSKYAKVAAVGVGAALGAGGIAAIKWGVGLAAANEQAQISFETMLGSAEKATSFLGELRDFAAKTPFEFPELQTAASSLISAGIEAGKVIPIMTNLGNATAGMGTGSEGIKRATVALQQMQAAGKITGEDLNQLRDAGIPVYDLLAASTGKAKDEVAALAQAGKLGKTELDQLMAGLESGKGLERFTGLMDKQSQSLSGLLSSLKDNLGQGLATAMEPVADEIKGMLPTVTDFATDALPKLGAGLVAAIAAGKDFAGWVGPIAQDVGEHLMPVLEDLGTIAGNVIPDALGMAGGAIVTLQHTINPLLDTVGALTGFLADHEDVVLAVVAAYGAWKLGGLASDLGSSVVTGVKNATSALGDMRTAIQNIAATRGVSETAAGLGALRATLTAPVSGGTAAGGALAGIAIGATIAFKSLERSADNGRKSAEKFIDSLNINQSSSKSMQSALNSINDDIQRLSEVSDGSSWQKFTQDINPAQSNDISESASKIKELAGEAETLAKNLEKTYGAAKMLGTSSGTVDAWVSKLDLDVESLGPKRLAWAIGEARNAAINGTPETDRLTEAYKKMSDETSNSTDKIDAWKDALDTALGKPRDLFDATTRYAEGLSSLQETLTGGQWGQFGTDTEAGRANRDALSGMVANVQDLANAYADMGQNDKAAQTIKTGRDEIVEAGRAAGISEGQVTDYLNSLGLTEGTWKAQVQLNGDGEAKASLDTLNALLENFDGKRAQAFVDLSLNAPWLADTSWWAALVTEGTTPWFLDDGKKGSKRWGGIDHMAAGGVRSESVMGKGKNLVWWDEPATGGEGYFPRNDGDRTRTNDNMRTVAGWYGGAYLSEQDLARRPMLAGRRPRRLSRSEPTTVIVNAVGASADDVGDALLFGTRR